MGQIKPANPIAGIVKKEVNYEVHFCMQINIEVFYKFILFFWVSVTRDVQNT